LLCFVADPNDTGFCPDGGQHETDGLPLRVPHSPAAHDLDNPRADDNHVDWFRYCVRCHAMVNTGQRIFSDRPNKQSLRPTLLPWLGCAVVDDITLPGQDMPAGQSLVIIGYDGSKFRLAWLPLLSGHHPRLDDVRYYHRVTGLWDKRPPTDVGFELFQHSVSEAQTRFVYTHVSLCFVREAGFWVVMYATANNGDPPAIPPEPWRPIVARFSTTLRDWSEEVPVFDPLREGAHGVYMHAPGGTDQLQHVPPERADPGSAYGAFILERYTQWDEGQRILSLTYLMSTWSPYQVHVMRTRLRVPHFE
jgi:hypothetical protein